MKSKGRPRTWWAAGSLVLWPNALVPDLLKKVCNVALQIKARKSPDSLIDIVALPVQLECGPNCTFRSFWSSIELTCSPNCPIKQYFESQISKDILFKSRALNPKAEVRPYIFKETMDNCKTTFVDIRNQFKDHSWICVVEGVSKRGLSQSRFYCHVDCNVSGWGSSKNEPSDRSQTDLVERVTYEETGLQINLMLKRKEIREFKVLANKGHRTYIYVPSRETSLTPESIEVQAATLREELARLEKHEAKRGIVCE